MLPTVTDSASSAPEITILPIPTGGAFSSSPITAIEDESPSPHLAAPDGHQSALKYYTRRPKTKAAPSADLPSSSPQPGVPPDQEAPIDLRRGVRSCTYDPSVNVVSTDSKVKEPTQFRSAQKDPRWVAAMHEEIAALYQNQTWTIVPRPSDKKVIGCKWLYKRKSKSDGTIDRYKARVVAKGYNQRV